jgi:hypothetical protein
MAEIIDFTYRPLADRRPATSVFFGLVALSFLAAIPSVSMEKYKGVASLIAVIFFVSAMAVYSRYLLGEYAYACFTTTDGRAVLTVTKTSGKRVSTMLSVYFSEITDVVFYPSAAEREKPRGEVKKYNYVASLRPKQVVQIEVISSGVRSSVLLEGSEAFANRLRECALIAASEREEE